MTARTTVSTASAASNQRRVRLLGRLTALTGFTSVVAVVVLSLTGHETAAAVAGAIGGGASTTGTVRVSVRIQR
ncbi:hypothetical protein [Streptomyces sp. NPDC094466]|uniref:hypothetical protein n=1 Tax=Streptomyces sp. NPDC094466 TaxID=3366065 RepID=UPI0038243BD0